MSVYECASLIYSSSSTPSQRCCFSPLRLFASGFMACRHLLTCQISTMRNCLPIFTMLWDPQMTGAFNCGPKATAGLRRQYHLLSPLLRNVDSLSAVPSGIGVWGELHPILTSSVPSHMIFPLSLFQGLHLLLPLNFFARFSTSSLAGSPSNSCSLCPPHTTPPSSQFKQQRRQPGDDSSSLIQPLTGGRERPSIRQHGSKPLHYKVIVTSKIVTAF